jgi:hypothetical protein
MVNSAKDLSTEGVKTTNLLKGYSLGSNEPTVSLKKENVSSAKKDLEDLKEHQKALLTLIAPSEGKSVILGKKELTNGSELSSLITGSVGEWRKLAKQKNIQMPTNEKCEFGFRRWVRGQGTVFNKEVLPRVDQQRKIIEFLFKTLTESRPEGNPSAPILLESIDREPIETYEKIAEGKPRAGEMGPPESPRNERDEFNPTRTFAQSGLVGSVSFRLRFVSDTETLRTYINKIRSSGYPVVITSLEVSAPSPEIVKQLTPVAAPAAASANDAESLPDMVPPADASADKSDKPAPPERKLIVQRTPSLFSLQLEYLSNILPPPASGPAKK